MTKDDLYSMILKPKQRCLSRPHIWHYYLHAHEPSSCFLEFGVWNGRSINYMADVRPDCFFYGFDSFAGLPERWDAAHDKGHFATDFTKLTFKSNVSIHRGWFVDTLPDFVGSNKQKISGIHIDCDLKSSTDQVLSILGDIILRDKPVILFDEFYNYGDFLNGEFASLIEFHSKTSFQFEVEATNFNHQQVLISIK